MIDPLNLWTTEARRVMTLLNQNPKDYDKLGQFLEGGRSQPASRHSHTEYNSDISMVEQAK
jgi:hypothetical protein